MNRWTSIIALLLAMLYLPATGHCALEQVGWFTAAGDCCEPGTSAEGSQTPSCADGCCAVESADYLSTIKREAYVLVVAVPACVLALTLDVIPKQSPLVPSESSPPESSKIWQFAYRTALPPRAPSFVS